MTKAADKQERSTFPSEAGVILGKSSDLISYITRLTRAPLLTAKREHELALLIAQGNETAKQTLVEANMRLVVNVARNYHHALIPFEDLIQEGAIGLMTAAERYDPAKGFRFSTYATHWIRQAISRAIDNKSKAIRIPAHVSESLRKIERLKADLHRELNDEPTVEQIALRAGLSVRKVTALLQSGQEPVSLDMLVGDEENTPLSSLINDPSASNPQEAILSAEMLGELEKLLAQLTPREREVMRKRMGFDETCTQALQEIGETMHISRERVRQIEIQALKKLKFAARRTNLYGYMCE